MTNQLCSFPSNSPSCRAPSHPQGCYAFKSPNHVTRYHNLSWFGLQHATKGKTISEWQPTLLLLICENPQWCSICDPTKIFLTSKFSYLLFSDHTRTNRTCTEQKWETTNSKPPRPNILIGQSETGTSS